ncbi:hypothetical protein [Stakelama pacifica]|nr:hypothetical protein [Stakelama pacifica]
MSEKTLVTVLIGTFFFAVVTMKIGAHMMGTAIQFTLIIMAALIAGLMIWGDLKINLNRVFLYIAFIVAGGIANILSGPASQLPSFLFVFVIYFFYIFNVSISPESYVKYLSYFQKGALVAAFCVFLDWVLQIAGIGMPNLDHIIPENLIMFNYVYVQPLEWGAKYMKPNGIFFLEASYISQFMAFGLIIEFCFFRRLLWMGAFGSALLLTFGGTGMLCVILCAPVMLFYFRAKLIPIILIVTPVAAVVALQAGLLQNIEMRSDELNEKGSSGNMRFTQQLLVVEGMFEGTTHRALVGYGSGVMLRQLHTMYTPVAKVAYEYGLIVYVIFYIFFIYCIFGSGVPFIISWMMLMQYLFLNGSFLVPINNFYIMMLCSLISVRGRPRWTTFGNVLDLARGRAEPVGLSGGQPAIVDVRARLERG